LESSVGAGAYTEIAPQHGDALTHPAQAVPAGTGRAVPWPGIVDSELKAVLVEADTDRDRSAGAGMLEGVGEAFLDDAVGRDVDACG
jgi:hypothetical protein